jgi:hypothetical protein
MTQSKDLLLLSLSPSPVLVVILNAAKNPALSL